MNLAALPYAMLGSGLELAVRSALAPGLFAARWLGMEGLIAGETDLPDASRSFATTVKAALDEVFLLTEVLSAPIVGAGESDRVRGDLEAAVELFDRRGWIADPARYHRRPPRLFAPAIVDTWTAGRRFQQLIFESRFDCDPEEPGRARWHDYVPNRTAHAWMLKHPGPPRPWLVCLHGYRMGFPMADFLGFPVSWLHDTLGLNLLFPILPMHGPRTVGRRTGDGAISGHFLDFLHLQAQAVWDVRRLLGWLIEQQQAPSVGLYGVSLGACTAGLVASLEDSPACVIAGVPLTCYVGLVRWNLPPFVLSWGERRGIAWEHIEQLVRVVSPLALVPRVSRDRRFIFAATRDQLVPPRGVRDLWWHWGRPTIRWYQGSHVSFLGEPIVREVVGEALRTSGLAAA